MKKLCILFALLPILLAAVLIGVQRPAAEQTAYLRLHVRANSDAAEDQAVKYAVKGAIVAYLAPLAAECITLVLALFWGNKSKLLYV